MIEEKDLLMYENQNFNYIMSMIFLRKTKKGSEYKLIPLDYQGYETLNVSCTRKSAWTSEPEGTIFAASWLTPTAGGKYYRTGSIHKVSEAGSDYASSAFRVFLERLKSEGRDVDSVLGRTKAGESKPEEPKKSEDAVEPEEPTLLSEISKDKALQAPTSSKDGFFVSADDWALLVRNIKKHINTMIVGPTGCGKTSVVKEICDRMGKKLYTFDMGTMVDPVSSLLGVHRLSKGESIFDYAKFTQVIKEPCVILLDELSRAPLSAMNVLFSCLDDRRNLNIEVAMGAGEREIDVNPEVTFIATANVGSEYSGTNSMDRALVNRFFPLELGYIPSSEESKVLTKRTGIKKDMADIIVKIANNIRSLCYKQEVSVSLSIRETLMVANLVADGWTIGGAMEKIYLPLYEGTKTEGERGIIYKTISSY